MFIGAHMSPGSPQHLGIRGEDAKEPIGETMARAERSSCRSYWVVEMERMLECSSPSVEQQQWKQHSIYRVPEYIKNMTNRSAYRPWLVSLAPFHHGEPDLLPMEEHKRRAVLHLVKRSGKSLEAFVAAVEEVADELMDAYNELDSKWREDTGRFVAMMVTDGCFLLEILRMLFYFDQKDYDYAPNDPDAQAIGKLVLFFLDSSSESTEGGLHPLDILHRSFCGFQQHEHIDILGEPEGSNKERIEWDITMPSAVDLSEAGIHFQRSKTDKAHDINFKNGVLSMPQIVVRDSTEKELLNLMAFERLHGSAGSRAIAFMTFMDNIIDSERDVALLKSKGIITNLLSSDKEAAKLFNTMGKGALLPPYSHLYKVRRMVNAHCSKRRNKWRASFVKTYLSNPWVFMSLVAAVILLVATLMQTVYTVVPFYTKS
ncbi:unnamed protein product [Urochloa decumbens]|uniref:Uncharacterized protein n=1 Tax=Urochloa decumbens TaxID=240449 RepID=A0ABC9B4E3_9POAL